MSMTVDEVIAKLRDWHAGRMSESYFVYDRMADAVQALKYENERLKAQHNKSTMEEAQQITRALVEEIESCCCDTEPEVTVTFDDECPFQKRIAELEAENERLKKRITETAAVPRTERWVTESSPTEEHGFVAECFDWHRHAEVIAENAKLRKERVRYVEVEQEQVFDEKHVSSKYVWEMDGKFYRIDNLPPRTPENTVPLKKEPSVVEQALKALEKEHAGITDYDIAMVNRLNAAGLLREEPK